ncbi:hypothetical protein [Myxococcus landrumensis]|uniref:STAS domain-containing protein n=1 Tax=Myxococcus landrumensis TaxID=2813577 RepID=A0ABX7N4F2_9BACT|nr:hypothetical protein [Myxococcus landrumus]QSQ13637.1 hypothetical protein JY572_35760 [Myxococcus landrumus]
MFEVEALVAKNRLVVRLWGDLTVDEARRVGDAAVAAIDRLRPRFDLLSDLKGVTSLCSESTVQMRRIMEAAKARGFRRVVRVVGRSAEAALVFERTSREMGYDAYLAFSLEEAERLLDVGAP